MSIGRRTFILSTSATAAGAAAWLTWRGDSKDAVRWCVRDVYPRCKKRVLLQGFQAGEAAVVLQYLGPKMEDWTDVEHQQVHLTGGTEALALRLPNVHSEYQAGSHKFRALVTQGMTAEYSSPIGYELRPFSFGA